MDYTPGKDKTRIDAGRVLKDIRSGASDSTLMARYSLSRKGLQSLFKKLEASGLLRLFNPAAVMQDLRDGASHEDLMRKYGLSAGGVQDLLDQLSSVEIGFRLSDSSKKPLVKRILLSDVARDITRGMDRQSLMSRYGVSEKQLRQIEDRLGCSGGIGSDGGGSGCRVDENTPAVWRPREFLRCYPILSLTVVDTGSPHYRGLVIDLSEKGIGLVGPVTTVDETKTLEILPTVMDERDCLHFTARCRWTSYRDSRAGMRAGFEITDIDESNLTGLRDLIMTTTACM